MKTPSRNSWLLGGLLWLVAMPASAVNHDVAAGGEYGFRFSPSMLTINVGDTVTFTNAGGIHNVVSNTGVFRCAQGCDGAGGNGNLSGAEWTATVVFNSVGTFGYFCQSHGSPYRGYGPPGQNMSGTIIVQGGAPPSTLGPGFTGTWFDPAQDGHGIFIEILPNGVLVAAWFVFTPGGQQAWIVGAGPISGNTAVVEPIIGSGTRFLPNFNAANVVRTAWGRMTFTFTSCTSGRMDWTSTVAGYGSGTMPLTRLTLPAGLSCPPPAVTADATVNGAFSN